MTLTKDQEEINEIIGDILENIPKLKTVVDIKFMNKLDEITNKLQSCIIEEQQPLFTLCGQQAKDVWFLLDHGSEIEYKTKEINGNLVLEAYEK